MPLLAPLRPALLAVALLAAAASAVAQQKTLGAGKPGGALLSRAELRQCLAGQDRLKAQRDEVLGIQAELAREKEAIERDAGALKARLETLDRTDAQQVDGYNAEVVEQDRRAEAWRARSEAFNARAEAVNADGAAWKRRCENRRYDEKDELAIRAGK